MPIFSLQIEKQCIGGLIKHPQVFSDIAHIVNEKDFYNDLHATAFCVIRDTINKNEKVNEILIANKIKNLGISFKDEINIHEYIKAISFTQITQEAVVETFKELIKIRIRREIFETATKLQQHAKTKGGATIDEIISESDAIYNEKISAISLNEEPINLFEDIEKFVEERGNNPVEDVGFLTPHKEFNRLYGGLRNKNLYAFIARSGEGKTTFLFDIAFKTSLLSNFEIDVLYLDTEMETEDMKWRAVSSLTGIGMWFLETGNWRKNPEMVSKVRKALPIANNYKFDHFKIGNKSIDAVCSIFRRWRQKKGRNRKVIGVYDYFKVSDGDKISDFAREYQIIGTKVDKLKKVMEELDMAGLCSLQMNRSGENKSKKSTDIIDDSSAFALSDRVQWYCTYTGIIRRKVLDETALDGIEFGTHKLLSTKTRFQGKDAPGHQDLIKRKMADGTEKYVNNYLSFDIKNFNVEEKGSLKDVMTAANKKYDITDNDDFGDISLD